MPAVRALGQELAAGEVKRICAGLVVFAPSNPVSGNSLIKADDLESAVKLARGCPVLASGGSVEVGETVPAM